MGKPVVFEFKGGYLGLIKSAIFHNKSPTPGKSCIVIELSKTYHKLDKNTGKKFLTKDAICIYKEALDGMIRVLERARDHINDNM
jgi:hypothetical protein